MTRLIDGNALIELINGGYDLDFDEVPETKRELLRMIMEQTTVDALPYEYIENLEKELRQKARESESQERKEFYFQNAEAIQRLLITWEVKGRGTVRGYDQTD